MVDYGGAAAALQARNQRRQMKLQEIMQQRQQLQQMAQFAMASADQKAEQDKLRVERETERNDRLSKIAEDRVVQTEERVSKVLDYLADAGASDERFDSVSKMVGSGSPHVQAWISAAREAAKAKREQMERERAESASTLETQKVTREATGKRLEIDEKEVEGRIASEEEKRKIAEQKEKAKGLGRLMTLLTRGHATKDTAPSLISQFPEHADLIESYVAYDPKKSDRDPKKELQARAINGDPEAIRVLNDLGLASRGEYGKQANATLTPDFFTKEGNPLLVDATPEQLKMYSELSKSVSFDQLFKVMKEQQAGRFKEKNQTNIDRQIKLAEDRFAELKANKKAQSNPVTAAMLRIANGLLHDPSLKDVVWKTDKQTGNVNFDTENVTALLRMIATISDMVGEEFKPATAEEQAIMDRILKASEE